MLIKYMREYLHAIIVDIKYFHTYIYFILFLVGVFTLSWRFLYFSDSTEGNKKWEIKQAELSHFVFFRRLSVAGLYFYSYFFFVSRVDGHKYARFYASATMNDVPSNKFDCRTCHSVACFFTVSVVSWFHTYFVSNS